MPDKIFDSKYPILEACMNKGSTLPLALAVHNAGAYPSLCSWTYDKNLQFMRNDLSNFVKNTGSNRIHLSFELGELYEQKEMCISMLRDFNVPTIEVIFHKAVHLSESELTSKAQTILGPVKELGTKIFRRILTPVTEELRQKHFLDGFCVKGYDSGGGASIVENPPSTLEFFRLQKTLTPDALVVPYGGIGNPEQVKEYFDLGATMVAVGTLFAASSESPIKLETKLALVNSGKEHLTKFSFTGEEKYKLNALPFDAFTERDDPNHTRSLVSGLYKKGTSRGHVYAGHSIDYITNIVPCKTIVENLCKLVA